MQRIKREGAAPETTGAPPTGAPSTGARPVGAALSVGAPSTAAGTTRAAPSTGAPSIGAPEATGAIIPAAPSIIGATGSTVAAGTGAVTAPLPGPSPPEPSLGALVTTAAACFLACLSCHHWFARRF